MVRHYDAFRVTPQAETKPSGRKPLEGLTRLAPAPARRAPELVVDDGGPRR